MLPPRSRPFTHAYRKDTNGQEVKIPAKPAMKVPRFTFSKTFKEMAKKARVGK